MSASEFNWDEYWDWFPKNGEGLPVITEIDPDREYELSPDLKREIDEVWSRQKLVTT